MKKRNRPELPEKGHALAIAYVPTDSVNPAPFNPRIMPGAEMEKLKRSIERFGLVDPIIVRKSDGSIIGGHQRYEAARQLGHEMIPAIFLDVTDEEGKILNVALNRIQGRWDTVRLASLLQELDTLPTPELELTVRGPETGFLGGDERDIETTGSGPPPTIPWEGFDRARRRR